MNKSKLQELCQKNSWRLPIYNSVKNDPDHRPHFTATVTVNDITFESSPIWCWSSKEAHNVAAEVALDHFASFTIAPEQTIHVVSCVEKHAYSDASSFNLQPADTVKVNDVSSISIKQQAQHFTLECLRLVFNFLESCFQEFVNYFEQDNNGKRHRNSTTTSEDAHARERGSSTARSRPQHPMNNAYLLTLSIATPPAQTSIKRILVCPRTADMIIPEGAIILPSSDDQWVAMAMTMPEDEYEGYHN